MWAGSPPGSGAVKIVSGEAVRAVGGEEARVVGGVGSDPCSACLGIGSYRSASWVAIFFLRLRLRSPGSASRKLRGCWWTPSLP